MKTMRCCINACKCLLVVLLLLNPWILAADLDLTSGQYSWTLWSLDQLYISSTV